MTFGHLEWLFHSTYNDRRGPTCREVVAIVAWNLWEIVMLYLWVVVLLEMMSHVPTCYLKAYIFVDIWHMMIYQHLQRGAKWLLKGEGLIDTPLKVLVWWYMIISRYLQSCGEMMVISVAFFRWISTGRKALPLTDGECHMKDDSLLKTKMEMEHQHVLFVGNYQ